MPTTTPAPGGHDDRDLVARRILQVQAHIAQHGQSFEHYLVTGGLAGPRPAPSPSSPAPDV